MNCDQVFDILTRGPFPTGTSCDAGVEAHLTACPECRRLAEALRPAIELFQESVGPEESRDLPGYWCAVATDRKQPVVSFAPKIEPLHAAPPGWTNPSPTKSWSALTAWRMAAMLALGVTLGLLLRSRASLDGLSTMPLVPRGAAAIPPAANQEIHPMSPAEQAALAAASGACTRHRLSDGPRSPAQGDHIAPADLSNLICCSECHNANSHSVPKEATAQVTQRCQICH